MTRLTLRRPTAAQRASNNDANGSNLTNLLQAVRHVAAASAASRPGIRRTRDAPHPVGNFGPNDYEVTICQFNFVVTHSNPCSRDYSKLDNDVRNNPLTVEQINRLPTERFQGARNTNDEENKCSVCWDEFEKNQVLRRLLCFHLFHKDCIDKWLKVSRWAFAANRSSLVAF